MAHVLGCSCSRVHATQILLESAAAPNADMKKPNPQTRAGEVDAPSHSLFTRQPERRFHYEVTRPDARPGSQVALLPWRHLPYTQHLRSSPASSFSLIHEAPRDQGNQEIKQLQSDPLFPLGPVTHKRPVPRDRKVTALGCKKGKASVVLSTNCRTQGELASAVWISTDLMLQALSPLGLRHPPWLFPSHLQREQVPGLTM